MAIDLTEIGQNVLFEIDRRAKENPEELPAALLTKFAELVIEQERSRLRTQELEAAMAQEAMSKPALEMITEGNFPHERKKELLESLREDVSWELARIDAAIQKENKENGSVPLPQ